MRKIKGSTFVVWVEISEIDEKGEVKSTNFASTGSIAKTFETYVGAVAYAEKMQEGGQM